MKPIKSIIVDDEPPAVALLEKYAEMIPQLEVVASCGSAVEAFQLLKEKTTELMFLDIRMPVLNGIDFLKAIKNPPAVIITTAYREYALDGYDLDIIDFLLKPISFDRFLKAVDRYQERSLLLSNPSRKYKDAEAEEKYTYFNINKTNHKVRYDQIYYIESLKDYVRIHMKDQRLVVKGNLGTILKQLPSELFVRIHRSYAIPIQAVQSYNQSQVKVFDTELPIGISFRAEVLRRLGQG